MKHLTLIIAQAIKDTLGHPRLFGLAADSAKSEIVEKNCRAMALAKPDVGLGHAEPN